jgi:hypothetical protein
LHPFAVIPPSSDLIARDGNASGGLKSRHSSPIQQGGGATGALTTLFLSLRFYDQTDTGRIRWDPPIQAVTGLLGPLLFL